jgi:hypothetical protein
MGTRLSVFFAVTDAAGSDFARADSLSGWYDVLSTPAALEGRFVLDVGESIKCWRIVLETLPDDPLYPLFYGTVSTEVARGAHQGGEPDGYFLDAATLARANAAFQRLDLEALRARYGDEYFGDLEEHFEATQAFLSEVVSEGYALAALWG